MSGLRRRLLALVAFLFVGLFQAGIPFAGATAGAESARDPRSRVRTITIAHEAHSLTSAEAAREYPIHLRAVVTYVDPSVGAGRSGMFVLDPTGSIFVDASQAVTKSLRPGLLIDLHGISNPGEFAPIVAQPQIKVIGYSGLPAATDRPVFSRILSGAEDGQWVEVEGVIHSFIEDDLHVSLQLTLVDGSITVFMPKEAGVSYYSLVDAKVRIRGNAAPLFDRGRHQMIGARIQCPNFSTVQIVEPPPDDPFKLPIIPVDRLLGWDVAPLLAHRVHVRGRVILFWPGSTVCLRDAEQGVCAQTDQRTIIREGELIDLAGFARVEGSAPVLTGALFRSAGFTPTVPQTATPVTAEQVLRGGHESQLIQIDGQMVSRDSGSGEITLLLSSGKFVFSAILPRELAGPEAGEWKNGSVLRITGICSVQIDAQRTALGLGEAVPMMFQVLVSTPADVVVLQRPSWWTPRNALVVVALILCSTLVVFGWVAALRNRVKQQTRLLRESEERFRHMALHDTLTGLATRLLLQDRLKIAVEAARRHQTALAFLIVDLDRFKDINDSFGHPAGDEVLRVSANRLLLAVRIGDTVARIGGDEFVVLLPDFDLKATGTIVQKLVAAMAVPIPIEERLVPVTVTIGACTSFAGDMDPDELMRNADTALYIAKNLGRNRFEIFTSEMTGPGILNEAPAAAPGQPRGSSS